ncbi:MAG: ATP-dependent helicase [Planctomycetota bacterium]
MKDRAALVADLNGPQREAVEWGDGPLLIVAGAGSGKTRVITRRVAHLIARGVDPRSILAITFTNKAAGEMRARVGELVGEGRVLLATFHAFCARCLRIDGERVGLAPGFTIYDRDDQLSVVKESCKELGIDPQQVQPAALLAAISRFKNEGLAPEVAEAAGSSWFETTAGRVYARYSRALQEAGTADFDDLLLLVVKLLKEHPDVLEKYRTRYQHVLVDEYQDTNRIQYTIARDLAAGHGNLCATGDPDQSIYRWRGARIRNILDFERDFPGAHVVRLEQNYRSTGHILAAASAVISNNPGRLMGPLWSQLGDGLRPLVLASDDEESEADAVVRRIAALRDEGLRLSEIAVFYRTNALSRGLERSLRLYNLPYELVGTVEFYERKEVKDLLAYLRVLTNPLDAVSFLRIVNTPTRGIGRTTLDRLRAWALPLRLSPREAARRAGEAPDLPAKARAALLELTQLLDDLAATLQGPVDETFRQLLARTRYLPYLQDFGGQEATERLENVSELEGAISAHARSAPEPSIAGFLQETALLSDVDSYDPSVERVTLMTLHAAKGLEFPAVFMVGLEEGLLPHSRSLESDEEIQEERRLCYVGMTRAQRRLVLSFAGRRALFGQWSPAVPSRFLQELPAECVEWEDRRAYARPTSGSPWGGSGWGSNRRGGPVREARQMAAGEALDPLPDADDYVDAGAVDSGAESGDAVVAVPRRGATVRHQHFGQGVVLDVRGAGSKARITVRFERFGDRQLMAEYARLEEVF